MKVADNKKLAAQPGTYNGFRTLLTIYMCKGSLEKSETEIYLWNTSSGTPKAYKISLKFSIILNAILI